MKTSTCLALLSILAVLFLYTQPAHSVTVSGKVYDSSGAGVAGVQIWAKKKSAGSATWGDPYLIATTGADGSFSNVRKFCQLNAYTDYVYFVQSCTNYPPIQVLNRADCSDVSGLVFYRSSSEVTYQIGGWVGVSGVMMSGFPGIHLTGGDGIYEVTVSCGWSGTVTPTKDCYAFNPPSATFNKVVTYEIQDFPATALSNTYTISGNVGVGGVTLSGLPGPPVSDASGNYTATVSCGWSATVTPTKSCYTFNPTAITYYPVTGDRLNNYTATFNSLYTISGSVGLSGVVLSGLPGSPVSDTSGNYLAIVPCGWSGTVTPVRWGYTFSPASTTYSNVAGYLTQNYTPMPVKKRKGQIISAEKRGRPTRPPFPALLSPLQTVRQK